MIDDSLLVLTLDVKRNIGCACLDWSKTGRSNSESEDRTIKDRSGDPGSWAILCCGRIASHPNRTGLYYPRFGSYDFDNRVCK